MTKVKNAITKPKYSNIFAVRFVVFFVIFMIAGGITVEWMGEYLNSKNINVSYRNRVGEYARLLYEAKQKGEDYEKALEELKLTMAIYQMVDRNYAEVHIGSETIKAGDTAAVLLGEGTRRVFFIEDLSYLDPVNEYMDGRFDIREYNQWISKNQYEFVYLFAYETFGYKERTYYLENAYVNWETHTFIPGVVHITESGKEYDVDCTPKDTKGYEKVESGYSSFYINMAYRVAPEKTTENVDSFIIPDARGNPWVLHGYDYANDDPSKDVYSKPWYVGYSEFPYSRSAFELAPVTSTCILVLSFILAVIVTLIVSFIKYQKDKTIWKIFEYRTKTTEAMAHDLKTPMAAIAAYAESMESVAGDAAKTAEYSQRISEKIKTMDHMVEDILTLSRSGSGKVDISSEEVNLMALVTESLEQFPDLKTSINGGQVKIKTDRKLFKQAIDNLLSNCDRYGEKESVVDIEIGPDRLTITNKTSESYPDVEALKKPFVKGSDSRSDKGTGLGLSIADNNLDILGFKLELESSDGVFKATVKFKR
ncbi:MAG: HAMP domain-containing histidine kinase [Clostridiales bacterium]|nr:HAMP domain-containing histidine kinase [Clostridiales bacterium]